METTQSVMPLAHASTCLSAHAHQCTSTRTNAHSRIDQSRYIDARVHALAHPPIQTLKQFRSTSHYLSLSHTQDVSKRANLLRDAKHTLETPSLDGLDEVRKGSTRPHTPTRTQTCALCTCKSSHLLAFGRTHYFPLSYRRAHLFALTPHWLSWSGDWRILTRR